MGLLQLVMGMVYFGIILHKLLTYIVLGTLQYDSTRFLEAACLGAPVFMIMSGLIAITFAGTNGQCKKITLFLTFLSGLYLVANLVLYTMLLAQWPSFIDILRQPSRSIGWAQRTGFNPGPTMSNIIRDNIDRINGPIIIILFVCEIVLAGVGFLMAFLQFCSVKSTTIKRD